MSFNSGLDASWAIAINWVINHGYKFGKDIVFNYGPLGFLTVISSDKLNLIIGLIFCIGLSTLFQTTFLRVFFSNSLGVR